jgi:hypothetical protein
VNSYRIIDTGADAHSKVPFCKSFKEAHKTAKRFHVDVWPDIEVHLVRIKTDTNSLHEYLNCRQPKDLQPRRIWKMSRRGGLIEKDEPGDA